MIFLTKKIKVLHVAEAAGGVEKYLEDLFKYSDSDKFENILICSQNYECQKFKPLVKKIITIKMAHQVDVILDLKAESTIRKVIQQENPDIVYAHSSKAGALARIANIGINNKVIYNPHGWAFNEDKIGVKKQVKHILFKNIEKIETRFTDKIICISSFEKKTALNNHIAPEEKLQVMYSGIDFDNFRQVSKVRKNYLKIPENSFIVGMVARITETKAPDIFIDAAKIIKKAIPNAFLLVGDGDMRSIIEKKIKKYNLTDSCVITGWVDDVSDYMQLMDVGTLLSRWEGFGLVLPEYMYSRVPIVATNICGIPDVIKNNYNGILVKVNDSDEVANAVIKFYKNEDFKQKIVKNAAKDVLKRFNVERTVRQTEHIYMTLIK